MEIIRS